MKGILTGIICLLFGWTSAQTPFTYEPISGSIFTYTTWQTYKDTPFPANGVFVITPTGAILIDSPWDTSQCAPLIQFIEQTFQKPVIACIVTHFHDDRTGSLDILHRLGIPSFSSFTTQHYAKMHRMPVPVATFPNDTIIDVSGEKIHFFYPGNGHTDDNCVVYFPNEKVLYGGCFIKDSEATTLGNLADANTQLWPQSIQKLLSTFPDIETVIPGHGRVGNVQIIYHTLELLKEYNAQK